MKTIKIILFLSLSFLIFSCSGGKVDPVTGEKKRIEPNVEKRTEAARDAGGGFFNSNKSNRDTTFQFSTSNVLWRASLKTLDFLPLQSVSYSGGLIITDWYENNNEAIKLEVRFLSSEISISSLQVTSYKRVCNNQNCKTTKLDNTFNQDIKNKIFNNARKLSLEDKRKLKK